MLIVDFVIGGIVNDMIHLRNSVTINVILFSVHRECVEIIDLYRSVQSHPSVVYFPSFADIRRLSQAGRYPTARQYLHSFPNALTHSKP